MSYFTIRFLQIRHYLYEKQISESKFFRERPCLSRSFIGLLDFSVFVCFLFFLYLITLLVGWSITGGYKIPHDPDRKFLFFFVFPIFGAIAIIGFTSVLVVLIFIIVYLIKGEDYFAGVEFQQETLTLQTESEEDSD